MSSKAADFIRAQTVIATPSLVPEIKLYLATEVTPLWHATEETLEKSQLPPPYWAFAWPGGQAVTRLLLDHPAHVRGRTVLDLGAGCGLVAIAAMKAGAAKATATEIDDFAIAAIILNAVLNEVEVEVATEDVIGRENAPWQTILIGDMCYEKPLADRLTVWLRRRVHRGATVLIGDPGRAYLPKDGLREVGRYTIPTSFDLEDRTSRETVIWQLNA